MKRFKAILPCALMILGLITWHFWGVANGHLDNHNKWDSLSLVSFLGGLIILFKRYVL